jgi:hypothetical protein
MEAVNLNSIRRFWCWLTLVALILVASWALLKYAGWSAIYSGYYGLPSEAWRLKEAGPKTQFYWWVLVVSVLPAMILATMLVPPVRSESLPVGLKALSRFVIAAVLVVASILILAYVVSAAGHYLK